MTHIAYREKAGGVECDADYVVVGSGAGGAAAAAALARGGAKVAIVEAGPWRDPEDYPTTSKGALRDLIDDWGATLTKGRALWPVVQARAVGGTTVINSAICVRTPGDIFDLWQTHHGFGGDALADKLWGFQDQIEDDLCVDITPADAIGRHNELAAGASKSLSYNGHLIRRYAKGCEGSGQCLQGCRSLRKQSTNVTYVPEVMRKGGAVLSCAPVHKVVFEGKRAIGVTGRFVHPVSKRKGDRFFVRARKAVIIAASVTQTPLLLRRSGVKHRALGHSFRAHPGSGVIG